MSFFVTDQYYIELPADYRSLTSFQRRKAREQYASLQNGKCSHCKEPLDEKASDEVMSKEIKTRLFPEGFFNHPVHLHHDHDSGMTIGAVHCHCNAVLWQYFGE